MLTSINQILPSLAALGVLAYWGIGLAAALEAFVFTGIVLPGTLIVDAGGFMVQRGLLDFFDLVWFVAIGSILGGEATFWAGHHLRRGLQGRWNVEALPAYGRAERLFARHGRFALVLGRFFGPVAAFVPFAAAVARMERRRFLTWNILSGIPYAFGHVGFGYLLGAGLTRLSPMLTREALFALALSLLALLLWWGLNRLDRILLPLMSTTGGLIDKMARHPRIGSFGARHPRLAGFVARRLDRSQFLGLPASLLALAFAYLLVLWVGLALDFVHAEPIVQIDARLAQLMHLFWTPTLLRVFTWITALGDTRLVVALLALAVLWLLLLRRPALLLGLGTALGNDLISVGLLKMLFGRPRSTLGYFTETSGSFPSGHATLSVAFYGMLFYLLWRMRRLGPVTAAFLAAMAAFLIGLSRLYLVEHYLSDVLAGWTLGGLCLVSGIAVAEWRLEKSVPTPRAIAGWHTALAAALSLALLGYAGLRLGDYTMALNPPPASAAPATLANPAALFATNDLPARVETLMGERSFPLDIAFLAPDADALRTALVAQGWTVSRPATPYALAQRAVNDLRGREDPGAALAPLFWDNRANDLSLSLAGTMASDDRPRLRLWSTRFAATDGKRLWLGLLSRGDGLDPEHGRVAADLAAGLADGLGAGRAVARQQPKLAPKAMTSFPLVEID